MKSHTALSDCYWIAYNPALHFGELRIADKIETGQKCLEIFNNEESWADRVRELGGEPYPPEEDYDEWTEDEG